MKLRVNIPETASPFTTKDITCPNCGDEFPLEMSVRNSAQTIDVAVPTMKKVVLRDDMGRITEVVERPDV